VPWDGSSVGEIVVRGNVVAHGYWNDEGATAEAIRDGWLHTGDLATIDPEGYVLIVDRKKDIIVSGGENVSSIEVEKLLYEHPSVLECAVIGVPDERWGEAVKAVVALRPGEGATEQELMAFCRSRLAGFKVPRSVAFVDALPKSGTGKILKRELREPYWVGADKRVH
jgi:acyl-CoA synthetase (AMP-forming)/AMP-acid ligase II